MAISVVAFPLGWKTGLTTGIDLDAATWQLSLHTATFTPAVDTMDFQDDLTNELATALGYTVGGVVLSGIAISYDSATDQIRLDFNDPTWTFTGGGPTWRYAVGWINTAGAASTDPIMLLLDWGSSQTVSGVYTLTLDPTGIYAIDMT